MAGDLDEQYQEGRGRVWYWRQTAAAIVIGRARFVQTLPWAALSKVMSRILIEAAGVLAMAAIVDQERRGHSLSDPMGRMFVGTLAVLLAVVAAGAAMGIRAGRSRRNHGVIRALMLTFGVIALGVGTLTRADGSRRETCRETPVAQATASTSADIPAVTANATPTVAAATTATAAATVTAAPPAIASDATEAASRLCTAP
jgi:hypothetical protein